MKVPASLEAFGSIGLLLYVVFAYKNVPSVVSQLFAGLLGKVVALVALIWLSHCAHPATVVMATLAVLVSFPNFEFMSVPTAGTEETTAKPPGSRVKDRKAPKVDVETKLRSPPTSNSVPTPKPGAKRALKPASSKKAGTELFTGYDSE